jgi:hypothetical protein
MPQTTPTLVEVVWLVAIAHVWARGSIFKSFRERVFPSLFDCPLCSGFWIGVFGHVALGGTVYLDVPGFAWLIGIGSLVGTLSLATYGAIRRL